jgi:hypothetical protein
VVTPVFTLPEAFLTQDGRIAESRGKPNIYVRGGQHVAEEVAGVGLAARRDGAHVPDHGALRIERSFARPTPSTC